MNFFKIEEIWRIGTRIYFGDKFVSIAPFEEKAYKFFSRYLNDPFFKLTSHDFCKRINEVYTQNVDALRELEKIIDNCSEFKDVSIKDKPSAIGLPQVLTYTHTKTNTQTEFDGVIFVSEKLIYSKTFSIEKAKDFVEKKGATIESIAQIGSRNTKVWDMLAKNISAYCNWRYVTGKANFDKTKLKILSINLIDTSFRRFTVPTMEASRGKGFSFLIGDKEHIRQVLAHESETYRYLKFLENRLRVIRYEILRIKDDLLNRIPLAPWPLKRWFNFKSWSKTISHWISLHRSLESIIKYKNYLSSFNQVFQAYKDYVEKGIAFYNLQSPITAINNKERNQNKLSQYPTIAPFPIEINSNGIKVKDYDKSLRLNFEYPSELLRSQVWIKRLADDTLGSLKSITTTSEIQVAMIATLVALIAILVSIIIVLLPSLVRFLNEVFITLKTHYMM